VGIDLAALRAPVASSFPASTPLPPSAASLHLCFVSWFIYKYLLKVISMFKLIAVHSENLHDCSVGYRYCTGA
jgi:hypothetical protein